MRFLGLSFGLVLCGLVAGCGGSASENKAGEFLDLLAGKNLRFTANSGELIVGKIVSDTASVSLASGGVMEIVLGKSVSPTSGAAWEIPVTGVRIFHTIAATSPTHITPEAGALLSLTGVFLRYTASSQSLELVFPSLGLAGLDFLGGGVLLAQHFLRYHRIEFQILERASEKSWKIMGRSGRYLPTASGGQGPVEKQSFFDGLMVLF